MFKFRFNNYCCNKFFDFLASGMQCGSHIDDITPTITYDEERGEEEEYEDMSGVAFTHQYCIPQLKDEDEDNFWSDSSSSTSGCEHETDIKKELCNWINLNKPTVTS